MPDMAWAWLIPALSAIAFALIVTVGRGLPRGGAFLAPLAALLGFALFCSSSSTCWTREETNSASHGWRRARRS